MAILMIDSEVAKMIVPVIYSLNPVADNKMYTWVFIKAVSFAKKYHWPVIAQEQYFDSIDQIEGFFSENLLERFEYEPIDKSDFNKIIPVRIPQNIEKNYVKNFPSQTDAYLASVRKPWNEMEKYFEDTIDRLEEQTGEKIEAFMTLPNNKFLENVSKKRNIPIIHFEWGPFRPKAYRKTAYFSFENVVAGLKGSYEHFIDCKIDEKLPIFTRQEILSLFLAKDHLHYVFTDKNPVYELGIVQGYSIICESSAYNMMSLMEIQTKVNQVFSEDDVCWRKHPEDPQHIDIRAQNRLDSGSLIDFILSCKRILGFGTNEMFEAMMFDTPAYGLGHSHYSFQANDTLDGLEDKKPDVRFLNYVAFCYLIPYELLDNVAYLRFRLSNPSEEEIYNYHLNYYLSGYGLTRDMLEQEDRLSVILQARGYEKKEEIVNTQIENKEKSQEYVNPGYEELIEKQRKSQVLLETLCANYFDNSQNNFEQNKKNASELWRKEKQLDIAILYLDYGTGFSEEHKLFADYTKKDNEYSVEFDIPEGVKIIRFDPCVCGERMLYYTDLYINGEKNAVEEYNIKLVGDKHSFVMRNPYFVLNKMYARVEISIKVWDL